MRVSVHQPAYLPWCGLLQRIAKSDLHVILDTVQFEPGSYANRVKIRTPQGWQWLTVPVQHPTMVPINDVRVAGTHWQRKHWTAIQQHYGRAPWFQEHYWKFRAFYDIDWTNLLELCTTMLAGLLVLFDIKTRLQRSSRLEALGTKSDLVLNICREVGATTYLSGPLGRNYLDEAAFERAGIRIEYDDWQHPVYEQLYPGFEPYMSAIDLLFNHGPEAKEILMGRNT